MHSNHTLHNIRFSFILLGVSVCLFSKVSLRSIFQIVSILEFCSSHKKDSIKECVTVNLIPDGGSGMELAIYCSSYFFLEFLFLFSRISLLEKNFFIYVFE